MDATTSNPSSLETLTGANPNMSENANNDLNPTSNPNKNKNTNFTGEPGSKTRIRVKTFARAILKIASNNPDEFQKNLTEAIKKPASKED